MRTKEKQKIFFKYINEILKYSYDSKLLYKTII